jgi:hypothetical protein
MLLDALVNFGANTGAPFSLVGAAGAQLPLPSIIDIMGNGVGSAPTSIYGRTSNLGPGADMGIPEMRPELFVQIGTAAATGNAAQLNLAFQAAADPGSAGNYTPAMWQTLGESGWLTAAQLTAGQVIFRSPWMPAFPAGLNPRFFRLLAQIGTPTGGAGAAVNFTAGTISWAGVTQGRDDYAVKFTPKNYTV